jgi:hypothetical protein
MPQANARFIRTTKMSSGISHSLWAALECAQLAPSDQSSPLSSQCETSGDAQPKVDRHDLANMALLFAMDGNYPGCWQRLGDDHDQEKIQTPELNAEDVRTSDEGEVNEEVMSGRLLPKISEPAQEKEERTPWAGSLSLVFHTRLWRDDEKRWKSLIPRPISAFPSAASSRKENRVENRGEGHKSFMSYVPTDAPEDSRTSPRCNDREPDEGKRALDGLYDESGFLIEEPRVEDHFRKTQTEAQQRKQQSRQPARPSQKAERYVEFVAETGISLGPPFGLQDNEHAVMRRSSRSDVEAEEFPLPPAQRPSPLFLRSRPEETRTELPASALVEKIGSDNGPPDAEPSILDTNDLEIPRQRARRLKEFVPFHEFVQEPGRFLRNAEKLRRQEERRQALYEATRAARNNMQDAVASSSRGTNMAQSCAKVRMQRSVSLFSWESGVIEELEISRSEAGDAEEIHRYAIARRGSAQGSQGDAPNLKSAERSDSELEAVHREMVEPGCSSQRAQPLKPSRNAWWEPELHPHMPEVEEKRLDQHVSEDLWSFIEGDDRDFTVVQQRQGMIHEFPEQWRQRASDQSLIPLNRYEYVQYDVEISYDPTQWPERRETTTCRSALSSDRCASCLSWRSAQDCSLCWTVHTQESVIDPSYLPMRVWDTVRVQGNEDEKRLSSETSSQTTVKKPVWCWPFRRAKSGSAHKVKAVDHTGHTRKGLWKPKSERRKLSKIPQTPKEWRKDD